MKILKKIEYLSFCLLFFLSFAACTERMDSDDLGIKPETARLVVDGFIGIDTTTYYVTLTITSSYFDANMSGTPVLGAIVTITEEETGRLLLLTEDPTKQGRYMTPSDAFGLQGYNYRLDISNVNIDGKATVYTATDYMPYITENVAGDTIKAPYGNYILFEDFGIPANQLKKGFNVALWIHEPPTHEYYAFLLYKNGIALNDTLTEYGVQDDEEMPNQGGYFNGFPVDFVGYTNPQGVGTNEGKNAKYNYKQGDILGIQIRSISKAFYIYNRDVADIYGGTNPLFGSTPSNVRGNLSNGAIGFFAAYSTRNFTTICDTNYTVKMYRDEIK